MTRRKFFFRRRIWIQRSLQLKYMGLVLFTIVIVTGMIVWTVYFTHWTLITDQFRGLEAKAILGSVFHKINFLLLLEMPVALLIAAYASIIVSHKIAGPVYRLEKVAYEVAKGDLSHHLKLRKNDELKNLARAFNTVVDNMQLLVVKDKKLITELSQLTDRLYVDLKDKKINEHEALALIRRLNDLIGELKSLIMHYKIKEG